MGLADEHQKQPKAGSMQKTRAYATLSPLCLCIRTCRICVKLTTYKFVVDIVGLYNTCSHLRNSVPTITVNFPGTDRMERMKKVHEGEIELKLRPVNARRYPQAGQVSHVRTPGRTVWLLGDSAPNLTFFGTPSRPRSKISRFLVVLRWLVEPSRLFCPSQSISLEGNEQTADRLG